MQMKVDIQLGKTKSVAAEWKIYSEKIFVGQTPSTIQYEQTRKAFYAGFYSCFSICFYLSDEDEDRGVKFLEALRVECEAFFKDAR